MGAFTPERHKTARYRVLQGGSISFQHLGAKIDCTVRSLSEAGVCLMVTSPLGIPNEFNPVLDRENTPRRCRVIWHSANRIGVKFQ
jgi:hypothetical protein